MRKAKTTTYEGERPNGQTRPRQGLPVFVAWGTFAQDCKSPNAARAGQREVPAWLRLRLIPRARPRGRNGHGGRVKRAAASEPRRCLGLVLRRDHSTKIAGETKNRRLTALRSVLQPCHAGVLSAVSATEYPPLRLNPVPHKPAMAIGACGGQGMNSAFN